MVTRKEMRLRQLIWAEFRSGSTKQEAIANIRFKIELMIDVWYQHFQSGKKSIFDNGIVTAIQTLQNGREV
jgi:hypothetical protein